jgi:hypothetical protein
VSSDCSDGHIMLVQLLVPGLDCDLKLNSVMVRGVPMAATGPHILYLQSLSKVECGSVDLPVRYLDTSSFSPSLVVL